MHKNPEFNERLWQSALGHPDDEVKAHLRTCAECQEQHQAMVALMALRLTGGLSPVSDTLTTRLNGLLQNVRPDLVRAPKPEKGIVQQVRTILANLIHDTAAQPQLAGLRGENRTRQIAFVSEIADLDLEVSPAEHDYLVVGQLGMDAVPENLNVRFIPAHTDPIAAPSDTGNSTITTENGYFRITMEPGSWVVAVAIEDAVVLFPGIEL